MGIFKDEYQFSGKPKEKAEEDFPTSVPYAFHMECSGLQGGGLLPYYFLDSEA